MSWALQCNPQGQTIKYFVSHSWQQSVKEFVRSIQRFFSLQAEGNLWICFLANPQTWDYEELSGVLTECPWQSPFALALKDASHMLVVRNANANLYERLWCVFERYVADELDKPVFVLGDCRAVCDPNRMGYKALCGNKRDTDMIRSIICKMGRESAIDALCKRVLDETAFC